MKQLLRVLIVEDSKDDAEFVIQELEKAGYEVKFSLVSDALSMKSALIDQEWDLITSDHQMPQFNSREALKILGESEKDIPFILVSGSVGEMEAVDILRYGARDYVLKDNLTRLAPAVSRELKESKNRQERRRAEETLKKTLKDLKDFKFAIDQATILAMTDASGVITYVNDKFCEISKYNRDELIGQTHKIVNSGHHSDEFFAHLWSTISLGKIWEGEIKNRAKDGSYFWIQTFIVPFLDSNGKPYQYVDIRTDITQRKEYEERLQEAIQARDTFLSIASHELKTPLTSLKLRAQMQQRQLSKRDAKPFAVEDLKRTLETESRQINRLGRLVDDMLDIGRISTGKLTVVHERFDLCELAREMIERYKPEFIAAHCPITLNTCSPIFGSWDRFRIEQVITNLLTNAIKYGAGKPISVSVLPKEDQKVWFIVSDQGMGIAKNDQARIFQRFERAISVNEVSGLGLGLFIAWKIIESHGGRIWVESDLGKGSKFFVELPTLAQEIQPAEDLLPKTSTG